MSTGNETLLTQAALDGELDAAGMLDFEKRLAANASLAAEYGRLNALREVMRRELVKPMAPRALRRRIAAMAAPSIAPRAARATPAWRAMAASAILAAGLGSASTWLALRPAIEDTNLAGTLVADHKRGLLSGQPADVASSDRHLVKPWFATRFALAPKVIDLGPQGFPLAGGRIDVIAGAPAPVLLYRHKEHFISLTALPAQGSPPAGAFVVDGYSVQVWRDGGTEYWAISDIDPAELTNFRQLFDTAAKSGPEKTG
ncbi:MAG: anti-sigma factor [Pseudomonadota bacterium]|nr:anti-sigma factor [Pseudomonadota bacterium]